METAAPRPAARHVAAEITQLLTPVLACFVIAGVLPVQWLPIDLASHFMPLYALGAGLLLALALYGRADKYRVLYPLACAGLLAFLQVAPFLPYGGETAAGKTLKVLQANVLYLNKNTKPFADVIAAEKPDIIVVSEMTPAFMPLFAKLKREYPYQSLHPHSKARGLAVAAKTPINERLRYFHLKKVPAQEFTVQHDGKTVTFLSVHPLTPLYDMKDRDTELENIAAHYRKKMPEHFILLGDFNATPYCPVYKKVTRALNLDNAREGRGLMPSWPTGLKSPLMRFLRIPIDHFLHGPTIAVTDSRLTSEIGSDHLPVVTTFALKAE